MFVAINAIEQPYTVGFDAGSNQLIDLISGEEIEFNGSFEMPGYSAYFWKVV